MENQNSGQGQQTINIQVPSADNIASRRPLIPASFALAIILFFFTFCDFKCGGQKIGSVTGINLVTGTELKDHDMFTGRETKGKEIPASIWAILAFGAAIIGLGAFLIKEKREALIGTGAGVIGAGSLFILQFVIKSTIDEQAKGQVEADLQFPYWGALIAFAVAGFISYLRMQKTHKILVSVSQPSKTTTPITDTVSQPQTTVSSIPQTSNFDIGEWLGKNKKIIAGVISVAAVIFGVYWFFIKPDPIKDAKKVAGEYCECETKFIANSNGKEDEFLTFFGTNKFSGRKDVLAKKEAMNSNLEKERNDCNSKVQADYDKVKSNYVDDKELLDKFTFAFNSNRENNCKLPERKNRYQDIQDKIYSMKDAADDLDRYKSILVGKWRGNLNKQKDLVIYIEGLNDKEIWGYDICAGNRRPVKGTYTPKTNQGNIIYGFSISLKEPGDDKYDGVFDVETDVYEDRWSMGGSWTQYQGNINKTVSVTKTTY